MFRDLLFSRFDTIRLLLDNDFPAIPEARRRDVAEALLPVCEPVFRNYPTGDDFAERPELRQMKNDLRTLIRTWLDDNGIPSRDVRLRKIETSPAQSGKRMKR